MIEDLLPSRGFVEKLNLFSTILPMRRIFLLGLTAVAAFGTLQAQTARRGHRGVTHATVDSTTLIAGNYAHRLDSLSQATRTAENDSDDVLENPYYFPLFAGNTLYDAQLRDALGRLSTEKNGVPSAVSSALLDIYTQRPDLVTRVLPVAAPSKTNQASAKSTASQVELSTPKPAPVAPAARPWMDDAALNIQVERPNFWTFKGNFSLQFMQYYVSDNWYKGGEDHNSLLAMLNAEANYDNKEKLTFSNKLEMRLGFQSSQSDTQHEYKTNADQIRLTNKLGLQAAKRWYYTVMLQSWTQFYPGYQANDPKVYSDFMSPFESVLSVGMDYKYKKGGFELSATLSPIAANYKYVDRLALAGRNGIDAGKHSRLNFGSTVTVNSRWELAKGLLWTTRFYAFTSYSRVQAEWENTFALKVNKYLSTKIFLYPRFDDGVKRKQGQSYFQFNEYLSVGLDLGF